MIDFKIDLLAVLAPFWNTGWDPRRLQNTSKTPQDARGTAPRRLQDTLKTGSKPLGRPKTVPSRSKTPPGMIFKRFLTGVCIMFDRCFIDVWTIFGNDFALIFHQILQAVCLILGPFFEASAVAGSLLCGDLDKISHIYIYIYIYIYDIKACVCICGWVCSYACVGVCVCIYVYV